MPFQVSDLFPFPETPPKTVLAVPNHQQFKTSPLVLRARSFQPSFTVVYDWTYMILKRWRILGSSNFPILFRLFPWKPPIVAIYAIKSRLPRHYPFSGHRGPSHRCNKRSCRTILFHSGWAHASATKPGGK